MRRRWHGGGGNFRESQLTTEGQGELWTFVIFDGLVQQEGVQMTGPAILSKPFCQSHQRHVIADAMKVHSALGLGLL